MCAVKVIMKVNRREFLKKSALLGCGLTAWSAFPGFVNSAYAFDGNPYRLLIINNNGGHDGLHWCQPASGALYDTFSGMRPTLKTDPAQLLSMDGNYGLHPNLTNLKTLYDKGQMAAILCCGPDNPSRSHSDAEKTFARGAISRLNTAATGFVSRIGTSYDAPSFWGVSLSGSDPAFEGDKYRGIQVNGLSNYTFKDDRSQSVHENTFRQDTLMGLASGWNIQADATRQNEIVESHELLANTTAIVDSIVKTTTFPQSYANSNYGRMFKDAEILLSNSSQVPTQLIYTRRGGHDTHSNQNTTNNSIMTEFNTALGTLINNLTVKGLYDTTMILVVTEFGRTNIENGSNGTDHGGGATYFLMGGPVNGGIYGDILPSDLTGMGWLPTKTYTTEVLRQVVAKLGLDPDRAFEASKGVSLAGIV